MSKRFVVLLIIIMLMLYGCAGVPENAENSEDLLQLKNSIKLQLDQGWEELYAGNFSRAAGTFTAAYNEMLPDSAALRGRGLAEYFMNDDFNAFPHLSSSIQEAPLDPVSIPAANFLSDYCLYSNTDYQLYLNALEKVIHDRNTPNWAAREYQTLLFDYRYNSTGEAEVCEKIKSEMNLVTGWQFLGPFSNVSGCGIGYDYVRIEDEKNFGFGEYSAGKNNWKPEPYKPLLTDTSLQIPVSSYYSEPGYASIYAFSILEVEAPGEYELVFSRSGSFEAWLDNEKIVELTDYNSGENVIYLRRELPAGRYNLLVKCSSREESSSFNASFYKATDRWMERSVLYSELFKDERIFDPYLNELCTGIDDNPESSELRFWLTYALEKKGWNEQARQVLSEVEPEFFSILLEWQQAMLERAEGNFAGYEKKMLSLAEENNLAPALEYAIYNFFSNERYGKAEAFLDQLNPEYRDWYYYQQGRLRLLLSNKETKAAASLMGKITEKFPGLALPYYTMLRYADNLSDEQLSKFISGLGRTGGYRSALVYNYRVNRNRDNFTLAKKYITEYLAHYPINESWWVDYINLLFDEGNAKLSDIRAKTTEVAGTFPMSYEIMSKEKSQSRYVYRQLEAVKSENNTGLSSEFKSMYYKEKAAYSDALGKLVKYYPQDMETRDELRELNGESLFGKELKISDSYSVVDDYRKSGFFFEDADAVVVFDDRTEVSFGDGASFTMQHFILKVLSARGVEDNRYQYLEFNPAYGNGDIDEAFILKDDGTKIYAQRSGRKLAFPGLSAGDFIVMKYRINSYMSGQINNELWSSVYLKNYYPVYRMKFQLIYPEDTELSYNYNNVAEDEVEKVTDNFIEGYKRTVFTVSQAKAIQVDAMSPPLRDIAPWVDISSISEWTDIVDWYKTLYLGQTDPDSSIEQKVKDLCSGLEKTDDIIAAIFNYVSAQIEYEDLSFQYSNFVPQTAESIFREGYGDCKDQSVLLVSMLKAAGIDSYLVLSTPGYYGEHPYLPSPRFTHAIVAVPINDRDEFLDPTGTNYTYGEMPELLYNTWVLPVTEGGNLVKINEADDSDRTYTLIEMSGITGNTEIQGTAVYQGRSAGDLRAAFNWRNSEQQKEYYSAALNTWMPGMLLKDFNTKNIEDLLFDPIISFTGTVPPVLKSAGNELFCISPAWEDIIDLRVRSWLGVNKSTNGISITGSPLSTPQVQTSIIDIPDNFTLSSLPESTDYNYGESYMKYSYTFESKKLICTREVYIPDQFIPEEDINAFREFLKRGIIKDSEQVYLGVDTQIQ